MRQFIKQTTASFLGSLAGSIFFFGLGTIGLLAVLILLASRDAQPQVKQDAVLVFDLATTISDTRAPSGLDSVFASNERMPLTLRQTIAAIDSAAADDRISGLFLNGTDGSTAAGFATLRELRDALLRFRDSGKPIYAYAVAGSERDYYLLSVADTIALNPLGVLEFNGFSARQAFFSGALEKYGVGIQIVRAGRYKSAVEPLVRQDLSPENREQLQVLLGDLWGELLNRIADQREVTPAQLQTIADTQGLLLPDEAEAAGLIDESVYYDGAIARLKEITGTAAKEKTFPNISIQKYVDVVEDPQDSDNKVAVVFAEGNIVTGDGVQDIGGDRYAKILRRIRQDEDVKAIVLRINSPGGSATASDILLRELKLTEKPVVVSMGDIAASGGYWLATGADRIFAAPNTITGSIGVFGVLGNFQRLGNDNGITWDGVKTGALADIDTTSRPKTEAELARYQLSVDRIYDLFLQKVADARGLDKDRVAELAQGRVWSGEAALEVGLVDTLGGLEDAISEAAALAELGDDWEASEYPRSQNFEERLFQKLSGEEDIRLAFAPPEVRQLWQTWQLLQDLDDPRGTYARLPFSLIIE